MKWVKLSDKLPPQRQDVLLYGQDLDSNNIITAGECIGGFWDVFDVTFDVSTTTHWMPMPEPPEEAEEG